MVQAHSSKRVPNLTDKRTDFDTFVTHPIQVHHMTWSSATTNTTISDNLIKTWKDSIATSPLGAKVANFYYCRAVIKLKVVVQGSAYSYGQIRIVATPLVYNYYDQTTSALPTRFNLINSSIVPHVNIDPSRSETYELRLPVSTVIGKYDLINPSRWGSYRLECLIVNPIRSGTATAPTVSVCVYMSLEDPSFEGLTCVENVELLSFEQEKKSSGIVSSFFTGASVLSEQAKGVFPGFNTELTLFSQVSSAVGSVLSYFGFAKPPSTEYNSMALNRLHDNFYQFEGRTTGWVLSGTNQNSLGLAAAYGGGEDRELLISHIVSIPGGIIYDFTIPQSSPSGTLLTAIAVAPMYRVGNTPTPLAGVARAFTYWVGDMFYRFEFLASVFHRATILIAWDPRGAVGTPPSMDSAIQTLQNTTVSIVGNTTVDIEIPYQQPVNFAEISEYTPIGNDMPSQFKNGVFYMWVLNPVVANGSTDPIALNIYNWSDNIEFAYPTTLKISGNFRDTIVPPEPENLEMLSGTPFTPPTAVSFGPSSDLKDVFLVSFGERYVSLKQLIGRATLKYELKAILDHTDEYHYAFITMPNAPFRGDLAGANIRVSFLDYFSSAFLGYRGGLRYSITSSCDGKTISSNLYEFYRGKQATPVSYTAGFNVDLNSVNTLAYRAYAGASINKELATRADFVVPSALRTSFYPTSTYSKTCTDVTAFHEFLDPGSATSSYVDFAVGQGAADDGNLIWFIGFPEEL